MSPFLFRNRNLVPVVGAKLLFYENIQAAVRKEIHDNPGVEVGGKFVGVVRNCGGLAGGTDLMALNALEIVAIDYLDAGPRVRRSADFHLPDGPYQERLFREIEKCYPEVEHLGTWHSHHPNGLSQLSGGDIENYFETVNSNNYNLDIFLASLMIDCSAFRTARHFLFVRGCRNFFEVSRHSIETVKQRSPYADIIAKNRLALEQRPQSENEDHPAWFETKAGRDLLQVDRVWIPEVLPGARCVLHRPSRELFWQATLPHSRRKTVVTYQYPPGSPMEPPRVRLEEAGDNFRIELTLRPNGEARRSQLCELVEMALRLADFCSDPVIESHDPRPELPEVNASQRRETPPAP